MSDIHIVIPGNLIVSSAIEDEIKITITKRTYNELLTKIYNLQQENEKLESKLNDYKYSFEQIITNIKEQIDEINNDDE